MAKFVHLHVHSAYSLRESTLRIESLVERAKLFEMPAVALTDTHAMYGVIGFYEKAKSLGIQPIIGAQFRVAFESGAVSQKAKPAPTIEHADTAVFLARGLEGYAALTRLVSSVERNGRYPYLPASAISSFAKHLIFLVGGGESTMLHRFADGDRNGGAALLEQWRSIASPEQLYVDLQHHQHAVEREGYPSFLEMARALDVPLVATGDARYLDASDASLHRAYAGLEHEDARDRWPTDEYEFASAKVMAHRFSHFPDAIENTLAIAETCRVDIPLHQVRMPNYPTKDGRSSNDVLREAALAGAKQRYRNWDEQIAERLTYELDVICDMGFADYFLVVADFIRFAHQNGISTGPGRGSAAGSVVAYALRITDVDPIANHLLFERFLNPARVSLPDIDTDFEYERRGEVIAYVIEKYGRDRVAQIGTFGTLAARAAIRDAGRMLQTDTAIVNQVAKFIPSTPGMTLALAREEVKELAAMVTGEGPAAKLYETAQALEGLPHHTSVHAAGVVIAPSPLADWVPLELGADETPVTQYAMADVETLGLVKMDFLGLRTLTLIDDCVRSVTTRTGDVIDWRQISDDDPSTYAMLTKADTNGVFQLESPGMRRVLRQMKPSTLADLLAVISLNRPGPMESIPVYCNAKHGLSPIRYPHPTLEPILRDTYGVIVYQEQIMQIASHMAGFTLGQADLLRRAVSKKKREVLDEERHHFVEGCLRNGYDETVADEVYRLIVRFADYGFNRSHAAAYAVLAFRTAYLRAHYLPDFLAALMTMSMGSPDKIATYVQDAKRNRIEVRGPSIVESQRGFSVDADGAIRTGLLSIRNVGESAVEDILSARRTRPWQSLRDFLQRINTRIVNRKAVDSLFEAGAFDAFFPTQSARNAKQQMFEEALKAAEEIRQFEGLGLRLSLGGSRTMDGENGTVNDAEKADVRSNEQGQAPRSNVLYVRYRGNGEQGKAALKKIQEVIQANRGDTPVALFDQGTRKTRLLGDKWRVSLSPELMTLLEDVVGIGNVKVQTRA